MMFGRAFEANGQIILPCEFCGCPAWEPESHMCPGLHDALEAEFDRRMMED